MVFVFFNVRQTQLRQNESPSQKIMRHISQPAINFRILKYIILHFTATITMKILHRSFKANISNFKLKKSLKKDKTDMCIK